VLVTCGAKGFGSLRSPRRHPASIPRLDACHAVVVKGRSARQIVLWAVGFALWTFLAGSCAGIVAMSTADNLEPHPKWPVGATVALVVIAVVWISGPAMAWRRLRRRARSPR